MWQPKFRDGTPWSRLFIHLINSKTQGAVHCGNQVIPMIRNLEKLIICPSRARTSGSKQYNQKHATSGMRAMDQLTFCPGKEPMQSLNTMD